MSEQMSPEFYEILKHALFAQGRGGMEQERAAYDQMGPEGFKQHSNMGTLDERGALASQESQAQQQMVMQQLDQMQKASAPRNHNYGTAAGNILGGVGDIARQIGGAYASNNLMSKQADLAKQNQAAQLAILDKKDAGRLASGTAQMEAIKKLQEAIQRQGGMGQQPGAGFGLQGLQFDPSLMGY
jgi:hypothetical protein